MNKEDIVVKSDKLLILRNSDELIEELNSITTIEDKYIFWEEFEEAGVVVMFNTTDYTNKDLVDSWNRIKLELVA